MALDVEKVRKMAPPAGMPFKIQRLGHVVVMVHDLERSVKFYTQILGFKISDVYSEELQPGGFAAAARLLWKIEKAYSLGIPKKNLALGESQTEEEHAYARRYTMFWPNGRSTGT